MHVSRYTRLQLGRAGLCRNTPSSEFGKRDEGVRNSALNGVGALGTFMNHPRHAAWPCSNRAGPVGLAIPQSSLLPVDWDMFLSIPINSICAAVLLFLQSTCWLQMHWAAQLPDEPPIGPPAGKIRVQAR
jgi:hypothetical protein